MEHCDALIVGGGPAGSSCAWRLKRAGLDVMVMDKKPFPRDKVCAGWITPAVVRDIELDCEDYGRERVLQPFYGFRTGMIGDAQLTTDYDRPVSWGIRRCEFDHYLLRRSAARLRLGEAIEQLDYRDGRWLINQHISTPLLIGAGGHFCPVARYLGAKLGGDERVVSAQEIEFEMTAAQRQQCQVDATRPELYFCPDLKGYGWCVRKEDHLNVGLGREDNHSLAQRVAEFRAWLIEEGRIPVDTPGRFHGHAYLLSSQKRPRPLVANNVMLIGDASGLAYPQSGEGIRPAIESALMAAQIAIAAEGDYRAANLRPYEDSIIARFGQRHANDKDWMPHGVREFAARRLLRSSWFARHVLIDRWFLHAHQPGIQLHADMAGAELQRHRHGA